MFAISSARFSWYDLVFLGLASLVVSPYAVLDWVAERTGKNFNALWVRVGALAAMFGLLLILMPFNKRLYWWHPGIALAVVLLVKGLKWLIEEFFGMRSRPPNDD